MDILLDHILCVTLHPSYSFASLPENIIYAKSVT